MAALMYPDTSVLLKAAAALTNAYKSSSNVDPTLLPSLSVMPLTQQLDLFDSAPGHTLKRPQLSSASETPASQGLLSPTPK